MSRIINHQVISYLKTKPRNIIIIHHGKFEDIEYLDIGLEFSKLLLPILNTKHISFKAQDLLQELLISFISNNSVLGEILPLTNCGILFENELQIDILALIDKYSKGTILILDWQGEVENNKLYFLDKSYGLTIDMSHMSHLFYKGV